MRDPYKKRELLANAHPRLPQSLNPYSKFRDNAQNRNQVSKMQKVDVQV